MRLRSCFSIRQLSTCLLSPSFPILPLHLTLKLPSLFTKRSSFYQWQKIPDEEFLLLLRAPISTSAYSLFSSRLQTSSTPYVTVTLQCDSKQVAELLSEALLCFDACSASIDEVESCKNTDNFLITSIFLNSKDVNKSIAQAAGSIGLKKIPVYDVTNGEECDWIKNTQELFQPVEVTDGLWVVPECKTPPDNKATNIILNPGLAFGTGEHPTTKLCLLLLQRLVKGGERVLDYGTGSGILGIAALKLGAALSVGVDIDPQAIISARQNATLNNIESKKLCLYLASDDVNFLSPSWRTEKTEEQRLNGNDETQNFDVVLANILLNTLIELADHIVSYAKPGAVVGLSGILSEQIPQIERCYSKHLDNIKVSEMDGWACVSGMKR